MDLKPLRSQNTPAGRQDARVLLLQVSSLYRDLPFILPLPSGVDSFSALGNHPLAWNGESVSPSARL
jgi:hypothetical protein